MLAPSEANQEATYSSILHYKKKIVAHGKLVERGVIFEGEPHVIAKMNGVEIWMAFLRDSENNLVGLLSEVPRD